jgi:hypothetical protein
LANVGRMYRVRPKQVGNCRRKEDRSFYAQITYIICIKRSSLHSLNSPNSLNSLNSCKFAFRECIKSGESGWRMAGECIESGESGWRMVGECIESGQFSKMAILASTRIRQNWRIFGEYSNSTNSPASGHCLEKLQHHKELFVPKASFVTFGKKKNFSTSKKVGKTLLFVF